jgi:predicted ATPase
MITKWGIKNFKSILDVDLDLAPLTIFCGVNSSGKSSFFQTIAMLVQNARDCKQGLDLNGEFVNLGNFERTYCNKAVESNVRRIGISFTISDESKNQEVSVGLWLGKYHFNVTGQKLDLLEYSMDYKKEGQKKNTYIKSKLIIPGMEQEFTMDPVSVEFVKEKVKSKFPNYLDKADIDFEKPIFVPFDSPFWYSESYDYKTKIKYKLNYKDNNLERIEIENNIDYFIDLLKHIPSYELAESDKIKYAEETKSKISVSHNIDVNVLDEMFSIFINSNLEPYIKEFAKIFNAYESDLYDKWYDITISDWYYELSKSGKEEKRELTKILWENSSYETPFKNHLYNIFSIGSYTEPIELPTQLKDAWELINEYFIGQIKYLGPLREEPKYIYETTDIDYIGVKGENTAFSLDEIRESYGEGDVENYYSPKWLDSPDKSPLFTGKPLPKKDFRIAMQDWLQHLGVSDDYRTGPVGDENRGEFELEVILNGEKFALPQLGTGVSQVFPILATCLSASPGSTVIIEQPESQLHPKIQARLADFFIAMSLSGRQCLIETHSEYIIEQLRYRILMMSDRIPLHEKTKLYFVTKQNGISHFKDIETNKFATLSDMPDDFFDESRKIMKKIIDEGIKKLEEMEMDEEDE